MKASPVVSICVPAYNAARFLSGTLDSIRKQTFPGWQLIVTEDGSDDGTADLVDSFRSSVGQPVHYSRHQTNQGLPATRNTGIAESHSEWIALLDSDDLWTADHLESCLSVARQTGANLIHSGSILFDSETGARLERRAPTLADIAELPFSVFDGRYIIQPSSVILRRSLWESVGGFDPAFRYVEDRDMWLRCLRAGAQVAYTGRETCLYRKHPGALSAHSAAMAEASARALEKHLNWDAISSDKRRSLCANAWAAAGQLQRRSDPQSAARSFQRALALRWNLKWQILLSLCKFSSVRNTRRF